TGHATKADYATAIQLVTFNNTSENPDTTDRKINTVVNDGLADGNTAVTTVQVTSVNETPINTVPPAQTTNEDIDLVFSAANGNAIPISDADIGAAGATVTLSVLHGVLTLGSIPAGLSFGTGDGTADATMTFTGSVSDINTALNGLLYHPNANFQGTGVNGDA